MYLCYIDESGTPDVPGNTSHFVLCGLALPISNWNAVEHEITSALKPFGLDNEEFHTGWLMRPYLEQKKIPGFAGLNWERRRKACETQRNITLLALQKANKPALYKQTKKNFKHTNAYTHLTFEDRKAAVKKIAEVIASWEFANLFAECIDKIYFNPAKTGRSIDEQAFEQIVSRFEQYVAKVAPPHNGMHHAILVHDNNQTVARKHTELMRSFHASGTKWTNLKHIVETPFFVDSSLTRMVQMADVCAWAIRRYCENGEEEIFNIIYKRAHRVWSKNVGVRHFTANSCKCTICLNH